MWAEMVLVLRDGNLIPNAVKWDDGLISDILATHNKMDIEQAKEITQSMREDIEKMGLNEIKLPLLEKIIDAKMLEYGMPKPSPIHLNRVSFEKHRNFPLSSNANKVLKKRYLRKDANGDTVETADEMFQRVAHHIAMAEKNYAGEEQAQKMEEAFYTIMAN